MANTGTWVIPAGEFRSSYDNFFQQLRHYADAGGDFGIDRIFEIFPFSPDNGDVQNDLIARGAMHFASSSLTNKGDDVDGTFTDENIGKVGIFISDSIEASYAIFVDKISFNKKSGDIYLIFFQMPPEFGMTPRVAIERLEFGQASYDVLVADDNGKQLTIRVDFTALSHLESPATKPAASPNVIFLLASEMASDGPCGGITTSGKWVINRATMSHACYVQLEDASPLGVKIAGPYDSQEEAQNAKQGLIQSGECES